MHEVPETSRLQSVVVRSPISELLFSRVGKNGIEIRSLHDAGDNRFGVLDARGLREALDTLYPEDGS